MSNDHSSLDKSTWFSTRLADAKQEQRRQKRAERQRQKLLEESIMSQPLANEIAARLDMMIRQREVALRGHKAELTPEATDTKELYRLRLPPGADPAMRRVRLHFEKYQKVVLNLAKISREDPADLLYELVQGTSYDSAKAGATDWAQHNTLMSAVNATLARLDKRFRWTELYERTASLRLRHGARCTWPLSVGSTYFSGEETNAEELAEMAEALADPSQVFFIQNSVSPEGDRPLLLNYFNGRVGIGSDFFYVPHALIGHVCLWDMAQVRLDASKHNVQRYSQVQNRRDDDWDLKLPRDDWDEDALAPVGQMLNVNNFALEQPFWLVVYPDPLTHKPVPALFQPIELSGDAFLAPLNRLTLASVTDGVWMDKTRHSTLAERLLEMVTEDEQGITPLERAWDRTGSWLQHNPVLKSQRDDQEKLKRIYEAAMRKRDD